VAAVSEPVRIAIVDDDALVRAGLVMMLDGVEGITVVGEAADGDEVRDLLDRHAPAVVLMDLRMKRVDGIAATALVRARPFPPEVLVLTTFDSDVDVVEALRAGASGFLLKDTPPSRIVAAVHAVAAGEPAMSPQVTRRLMQRVALDNSGYERARRSMEALSPRETEVVLAMARGRTNAEIGTELFMSVATVKAHITRILTKLDLTNRTQVALLVREARLD
jgi:DNA-binding NarL/FixJ family response regulator